MFKIRKNMLIFLGLSIIAIIVLTLVFYNIKSKFIFNIINNASLSTGFVSFLISIYIVNYTDDIKTELKIKQNQDSTKDHLKKDFQEKFSFNINIINKFYSALNNNQIDQVIMQKDDIFTILTTYKILLEDVSIGMIDLDKYISRLENKNFEKQITKHGNKTFFKTNTIMLTTVLKTLFKELGH